MENFKENQKFLNWYTENFFDFYTRNMNKKEKKQELKKQLSMIKNINDLMQAFNDTETFRNEMNILEHGYATATGSNYDKMVVIFRGKKYVINDREHFVTIYNGENGFS